MNNETQHIFNEAKEQFSNGCTTAYGEPQAFVNLPNGRYLEITLEQEGLPETEQFYSVRLCANDDELDTDICSPCGVIEQFTAANATDTALIAAIEQALDSNTPDAT